MINSLSTITVCFPILITFLICSKFMAQDVNPRVFYTNADEIKVYPDMSLNLKPLRVLNRGFYLVGHMPLQTITVNKEWIEVLYPISGFIHNIVIQESYPNSVDSSALIEINVHPINCRVNATYVKSLNMLSTCGFSRSWMQQWPVGNGISGALIGGSLSQENIPISVSDLFVNNRNEFEEYFLISRTTKTSIYSSSNTTKAETFQKARESLFNGDHQSTFSLMDKLRGGSESRFEYLSDLTMLYLIPKSHGRIIVEESPTSVRKEADSKNLKASIKLPEELRMDLNGRKGMVGVYDHGGREELFKILSQDYRSNKRLNHKFRLDSAANHESNIIALTKVLSTLQLTEGVVTNSFLVPIPKPQLDSYTEDPSDSNSATTPIIGLDLHHRQWFASEIDDVIVGKISCHRYRRNSNTFHAKKQMNGCLDLMWRISRDASGKVPTTTYRNDVVNTTLDGRHVTQFRSGMSLSLSKGQYIPSTFSCVAINCFPKVKSVIDGSYDTLSTSGHCLDTEEAFIVSHVEKQDNLEFLRSLETGPFHRDNIRPVFGESIPRYHSNFFQEQAFENYTREIIPNVLKDLESKCWLIVDQAVAKGYEKLYYRHTQLFKQRMNRMKFEINGVDTANPATLENPLMTRQIPLGSIIKQQPSSSHHARDIAGMYEFGRYLLFSTASKRVANLQVIESILSWSKMIMSGQGLWSESRKTVWNGDYHLNINMQMMYWASDASRMDETLPPLFEFISRLSKIGTRAAKNLYNCNGWVAHGFTDGYLDGGINGEIHWALCVTCGAWMVLHIWDHITYKINLKLIAETFLPIVNGVALFFMDYFYRIDANEVSFSANRTADGNRDYYYFTGPSTSPETSFSTSKFISSLAFNSAFDLSILRQVANAYLLAVEILENMDTSHEYMNAGDVQMHHLIAGKFKDAVRRFPFRGLPINGPRSRATLEYPLPFPKALTTKSAISSWIYNITGNRTITSEEDKKFIEVAILPKFDEFRRLRVFDVFDSSHRHFSHLEWLYPGLFLPHHGGLPVDEIGDIYEGAMHALLLRRQGRSGHTAWSSAWMSCLWSRLGSQAAEESWGMLVNLVNKYTTQRFLSMHPFLFKDEERLNGQCQTCFSARDEKQDVVAKYTSNLQRLLTNVNNAIFQLDGNIGIIAAVNEMILQSHIPGFLLLGPAIPSDLAKSGGRIINMRARGDIDISFAWTSKRAYHSLNEYFFLDKGLYSGKPGGKVYAMRIMATSYHPWYSSAINADTIGGMSESSGLFTWRDNALVASTSKKKSRRMNDPEETIVLVLPHSEHYYDFYSSSTMLKSWATEESVISHNSKSWRVTWKPTIPISTADKTKSNFVGCAVIGRVNESTIWSSQPYHIKSAPPSRPVHMSQSTHGPVETTPKIIPVKKNPHPKSPPSRSQKPKPMTPKVPILKKPKPHPRSFRQPILSGRVQVSRKLTDDNNNRVDSSQSPGNVTEVIIQIRSYPCEIIACWKFGSIGLNRINSHISKPNSKLNIDSAEYCRQLVT